MATPTPGQVIAGRYKIVSRIGRGGMGTVYRAEHVTIGRPVALKLLEPALRRHETPNLRMAREAFATGRVSHPNCVTISDCGALEDGSLYLAMELLEGRDLGAELKENGAMEPRRALRIVRDVALGLAHAHSVGVVHRDIKPNNIFLVDRGDGGDYAKVLDFGIAKLIGDARSAAGDQTLTADGIAIGSPTYMSPEQALGSNIDARTDLYSLAVVLFEMIAGRPPFDDEDKLAVLRMHIGREPPRLSERAPAAAALPGLDELVARGMAKTPAERIASAREVVAAIDAILAPPRDVSAPIALPVAAPKRNRGWWIALAGLLILGLVGVGAAASGDDAAPSPAVAAAAPSAAAPSKKSANTPPPAKPEPEPEKAVPPDAAPAAEPEPAEPAEPASDAEPAAASAHPAAVAELQSLRQRGHFGSARNRARDLVRRYPNDAALRVLQGHIFMDRMWWHDGFDAYRRAAAIDPERAREPEVIANAIRSLSSRSQPWRGERFIKDCVGPAAIGPLEQAAQSTRSRTLKRRAQSLLRWLRARERTWKPRR